MEFYNNTKIINAVRFDGSSKMQQEYGIGYGYQLPEIMSKNNSFFTGKYGVEVGDWLVWTKINNHTDFVVLTDDEFQIRRDSK